MKPLQILHLWYQQISKSYDNNTKEFSKYSKFKFKPDRKTIYIGQLDESYNFLILIILLNIGMEDLLNFPNMVYEHGGATFLLIYFIVSVFIVLPMYITEIGLAQFYSRSPIQIFNIVPIFKGFGWTMMISSLISTITCAISISPSFMYFGYTFSTKLPWTYCSDRYPKLNCTMKYSNSSQSNKFPIFLTPTQIFYDIEILGSRTIENGSLRHYRDPIGSLRVPISCSLLSTWLVAMGLSFIILGFHFKTIIYFISFIFSLLLILTLRTLFLPGAFQGVVRVLQPDIYKTFTKISLMRAICHCLSSLTIGTSSISAIASLNKFHYNFYKAARLLITWDFLFGIVASIMGFSVLGYMAALKKEHIKEYEDSNKIVFQTFINGVTPLYDGRILIILFALLTICIGISNISLVVVGIVWSLVDTFPRLFEYSENKKLICCALICGLLCTIGLLFSFDGMNIYRHAIDAQKRYLMTPCVILIQIIIVHFVYGHRRFRSEMKMMLGISYNCIWVFSSMVFIPFALLFSLSYTIYLIFEGNTSLAIKLISSFSSCTLFLPLIIYGVMEIFHNYHCDLEFHSITGVLKTPEIMGPYYKTNWLINKFYQKKLVALRDNPTFWKTLRETEDLGLIMAKLHQMLNNDIIRKERLKDSRDIKPKFVTL